MTEENEKELFEKYPQFFQQKDDYSKSLMRFGFPGDGWKPLLVELFDKMVASGVKCEVVQVKEKFGTLRFYVHYEDNTQEEYKLIEGYIREAEAKSEVTCEDCGAPGKLYQSAWWRTKCEKCEDEYQIRRIDLSKLKPISEDM